MTAASEFEQANAQYAETFNKGHLELPPARGTIVIVCMDARIDPAAALGLQEGDAHVIRNAGGRASEALRSVIISQQLLGTKEVVVIHHTDCGMLTFTNDQIHGKIREDSGGKLNADHIAFLPFSDLDQSVKEDVTYLKEHPLVADVPISGYNYDVKTGKIHKVI